MVKAVDYLLAKKRTVTQQYQALPGDTLLYVSFVPFFCSFELKETTQNESKVKANKKKTSFELRNTANILQSIRFILPSVFISGGHP